MRSKQATWFECKIAFEKTMENGLQKRVVEKYVVNALSFFEAESRIVEEMEPYISGAYELKGIVPARYKEIFFMNEGEKMLANQTEDLMHAVKKGDAEEGMRVYEREIEEWPGDTRWYKAKVQFLTLDEKTEKEKRTTVYYLVEACSVYNACQNIESALKGTMIDYVIVGVNEQQIVDVFEEDVSETQAAKLMALMAEELKDHTISVESIVDKYVKSATPELRQQLIDKLNDMRASGQVPEKK